MTMSGCMLYFLMKKKSRAGIILFSGIIGAQIAFLSVMRTTHISTPSSVETYALAESVEVIGKVSAEPDRRPLETKYTLDVQEVKTASGLVIPVEGRVLVSDKNGYPLYYYGDTVRVSGMMEKPGAIENFSYDQYLSLDDIYAVMYRARVELINPHEGLSVLSALFSFKEGFEDRINRLFPEPHASFMAGLLTGTRKGIPDALNASFRTVGLTHIIAISGYNISIIITLIGNALFWLPLKQRFIPSILAITVFTIFVGASAAVVRAAIMGVLGLIAIRMERLPHARLTVLWAAFFMVLWNPKYLWYDSGFQLSFAAVIGLMEISPLIERYCKIFPETLGIRESLQMTMSAQIATLPLCAMFFGELSLIAPIANILAAPVIPLSMLLGFTAVVMSFLSQTLALMIAYVGWLLLQWIILVATFLSYVPYASVPLAVGALITALYYLLLTAWKMGFCCYVAKLLGFYIERFSKQLFLEKT